MNPRIARNQRLVVDGNQQNAARILAAAVDSTPAPVNGPYRPRTATAKGAA